MVRFVPVDEGNHEPDSPPAGERGTGGEGEVPVDAVRSDAGTSAAVGQDTADNNADDGCLADSKASLKDLVVNDTDGESALESGRAGNDRQHSAKEPECDGLALSGSDSDDDSDSDVLPF